LSTRQAEAQNSHFKSSREASLLYLSNVNNFAKGVLTTLFTVLLAWIRLGRFHFLVGGFILHSLGLAIALTMGAVLDLRAILWGQIAITATQLMTHYANDYFDLRADDANRTPTNWSGGSRMLVEGRIHPRTALSTALIFAGVAFTAILVLSLVIRPGIGTFLLLFTALALAWFYSAPPIRLHSLGLGELTTAVVVTLLTPLTGYLLQTGRIDLLPILAALPLCCFQFAMLLAIEFPDAEGDRKVNKRTLVVRLGAVRAVRLYLLMLVLAYVMLPILVLWGLPEWAALAIGGLSPLTGLLLWLAGRGDWHAPTRWNNFGFYTILLLMTSAMAELGAFILLIGMQ
jgi:1,4-dihydroxy-2-naphthoate polyprenyltransferase